jgi:hypothetical protein
MTRAARLLALAACVACAEPGYGARAFGHGEELTFIGGVGPLRTVTIQLSAQRARGTNIPVGATWCFTAVAGSSGLLDLVLPIHSRVESLALADTMGCLRYAEDRREGRRWYDRTTTVNYGAGRGAWENHRTGSVKKIKRVTRPVPDLLGLMYAVRCQAWAPGTVRDVTFLHDGKLESLTLRADRARMEAVGVWGAMPVLDLIADEIIEKGRRRKGPLVVTVTDDARHVPLRVTVGASFGRLELDLTAAAGLAGGAMPVTSRAR